MRRMLEEDLGLPAPDALIRTRELLKELIEYVDNIQRSGSFGGRQLKAIMDDARVLVNLS